MGLQVVGRHRAFWKFLPLKLLGGTGDLLSVSCQDYCILPQTGIQSWFVTGMTRTCNAQMKGVSTEQT